MKNLYKAFLKRKSLFLVTFIITCIALYYLYDNESFKETCQELGVKCETTEIIETAKSGKDIFLNVLHKIKSIPNDWQK